MAAADAGKPGPSVRTAFDRWHDRAGRTGSSGLGLRWWLRFGWRCAAVSANIGRDTRNRESSSAIGVSPQGWNCLYPWFGDGPIRRWSDLDVAHQRLVSCPRISLEKKVSVSHTLVHVGTHIGVHGYLSGRTLKAVEVTVYVEKHPAKPKEHTVRGTVVGTGSGWINVALGAKQYHFVLAPGAVVIYRLLPTDLSIAKVGQRVDVRE